MSNQQPQQELANNYPISPLPFSDVDIADEFWTPRIETNRTVTIPFAFQQCEASGRVDLFRRAAAVLRGEPTVDKTPPGYPFDDTDVYKVIEAAGYALSVRPDPDLEKYVDDLVDLIASAQESDGYLYTTRTICPENPNKWAGTTRWELERQNSHELYNLGHLYEAAVAYSQATGKRRILDIAVKSADLLVRTFGPGKASIWPGHQITEMALVKLGRAVGNPEYIDLARFMLDQRGPDGSIGSGSIYNQSHQKILDQTEAVGHAVRAGYMYAGIADVAAVTGDTLYIDAIDRIWQDVVGTKLYITGGIGARHEGEAFGSAYELPNDSAYCETCASIANVFWNHRLFLLHGDARYVDVLERSLYNGLLSGVSLDGMLFFYENPLESPGGYNRSPWFGCACCPSNVSRFLPSLAGYVYAQKNNSLYVNLYAGSSTLTNLAGRSIRLTQQTRYPWNGTILLTLEVDEPTIFDLRLRIPGWARNEVVPSDLYTFLDLSPGSPSISVNGEPIDIHLENGYAVLSRRWRSGDQINLHLPIPVRRVLAHHAVEANRGRVALQRGPLVYCLEGADNHEKIREIKLPDDMPLHTEYMPDLLNGIIAIKSASADATQQIIAVPYYAWSNRGGGEMIVWVLRDH